MVGWKQGHLAQWRWCWECKHKVPLIRRKATAHAKCCMMDDSCFVVSPEQLSEVLCSLGAIAQRVTSVIKVRCMARLARVVAVGVPHHVTQRGNGRQFILGSDPDRRVYLDLLRQGIALHGVELIGYCLMSNHVHLVAVPHNADGLGLALKNAQGRYASYWNASHHATGHVWQGRYYSCPLDEQHLWEALRYTELNPVRAGMVDRAERWAWSSAAIHCGGSLAEGWLAMEMWRRRWPDASWREYWMPGRANRNWCRFVAILTLVAPWEMRSSSVRWKGKRNACWLCKSVAQERGRIGRNARAHFPSASRRLSKNCTDDRFRWGYFRPSPYLPYFWEPRTQRARMKEEE